MPDPRIIDAYQADAHYWRDEAHRLRAGITNAVHKLSLGTEDINVEGFQGAIKQELIMQAKRDLRGLLGEGK